MSPIPIPNIGFYGVPVKTRPELRVPSCNNPVKHTNPEVRELISRANEQYLRTLGFTIISTDPFQDISPEQFESALAELIRRGVNENEIFYTMDEAGKVLYVSSPQVYRATKVLQFVGGLTSAIQGGLKGKESMFGTQYRLHRALYSAYLSNNPNSIVLNTGAGADYATIASLKHGKKEGVILSHDVTPALQVQSEQNTPEPYICVATLPQTISPIMEVSQRKKEVFLKDTLSSLSGREIQLLIESAKEINASQITVVQSLGISDTSNFIGDAYGPGYEGNNFCNFVDQYILRYLINQQATSSRKFDPKAIREKAGIVLVQAKESFCDIFTDLLFDYFKLTSRNNGFNHIRVLKVETFEDLSKPDGNAFLKRHCSGYRELLKSNKFNTLSLGPFGGQREKRKLPGGTGLRVIRTQYILQASQNPLPEINVNQANTVIQTIPDNTVLFEPFLSSSHLFFDNNDPRAKVDHSSPGDFGSSCRKGQEIVLDLLNLIRTTHPILRIPEISRKLDAIIAKVPSNR